MYFNNQKFLGVRNVMTPRISMQWMSCCHARSYLDQVVETTFVCIIFVKLVGTRLWKQLQPDTENSVAIFEHKGLEVKLFWITPKSFRKALKPFYFWLDTKLLPLLFCHYPITVFYKLLACYEYLVSFVIINYMLMLSILHNCNSITKIVSYQSEIIYFCVKWTKAVKDRDCITNTKGTSNKNTFQIFIYFVFYCNYRNPLKV